MSQSDAIAIYRQAFWVKNGYGNFPDHGVAAKTFDLCVNMGPRQAHKILQRAINAARGQHGYCADDGAIGPATRAALHRENPSSVLAAMRSEAAAFYRELATRRPVMGKYLDGWLKRAYS